MPPKNSNTNEKKSAPKRAPTAYQQFMKAELARLKALDPKKDHKARFSEAAKNWSANKK